MFIHFGYTHADLNTLELILSKLEGGTDWEILITFW